MVFACDDAIDLMKIVNWVGYTGTVEIRPSQGIRLMDYSLRFPNKENLNIFIEDLS